MERFYEDIAVALELLPLVLRELATSCVLVPMVLVPEHQQLSPYEFCKIRKVENCKFLVSETRAALLDLI